MNEEKIIGEIAKKINVDEASLTLDKRFQEDLNLDSIDLVEILMDIEEEHNVEIPDEKAITIKTVGDFVSVIMEEING